MNKMNTAIDVKEESFYMQINCTIIPYVLYAFKYSRVHG